MRIRGVQKETLSWVAVDLNVCGPLRLAVAHGCQGVHVLQDEAPSVVGGHDFGIGDTFVQ